MKARNLYKKARELQTISTDAALWHLLKTNAYKATLLLQHPPYHIFNIPKKNGGLRLIEDPASELKKIQSKLNEHLQPLYFFNKTDAAYAFMIKPDDDPAPRNIVTGAQQHCANAWLLNIDIRDFFHYVSWQILYERLTEPPFSLHTTITQHICHLCTFNGRLPMGAPTSPVLSNIAMYELDTALLNYCRGEQLTYTRFADDMSFSSANAITERQYAQLAQLVKAAGYILHDEKVKRFAPQETRQITGLVVTAAGVAVPDSFFEETRTEIQNLKTYVLMQTRLFPHHPLEKLIAKPLQKIKGALAFIEAVHGAHDARLGQLEHQLELAQAAPEDYESLHWLAIGYDFF